MNSWDPPSSASWVQRWQLPTNTSYFYYIHRVIVVLETFTMRPEIGLPTMDQTIQVCPPWHSASSLDTCSGSLHLGQQRHLCKACPLTAPQLSFPTISGHTHTLIWLIKSLSGHLRSGCYRGNSCQLEKQLICKQAGQQQAWAFQSRAGPLRRADKTAAGYLLYILIKCLLTTVILTVIKLLL